MSRKVGSRALNSLEGLLAEQELHVRPDRGGRGPAVVVHRLLVLEVPPGRGVELGEVGPRGSGNFRRDRSGLRTLRRTTAIMPALVVPRAVLMVNGTSGTPPCRRRGRGR